MYFQKLENLSHLESFKSFNPIIDTLDSWLAFLPKSYQDKIVPEIFSSKEGVPLKIVYKIFDKLLEEDMLKERYIVRCPYDECNHVMYIADDLKSVNYYIINHNLDEIECNFCEKIDKITTDNVFVIYELLDEPREDSGKKNSVLGYDFEDINSRNLTDRIKQNPEMYERELSSELLEHIFSDLQ